MFGGDDRKTQGLFTGEQTLARSYTIGSVPPNERGLYETLITEALEEQLGSLGDRLDACRSELHEAEAADRLALHLSRVVERAIASLDKNQRVARGTDLARQLVNVIVEATTADTLGPERPVSPANVLRSVVGKLPDGRFEAIPTPLIPLLDTTLLTNAPGEPRVGNQVLAEIHSADRIDVVMAFIRRSGIAPLLDALRAHCGAGRKVRVLTTTYTGSTEARALDELRDLGAEVRVSYDETSTRLHAKAWLFHRRSGFSTAYIGSSNLTHSAQVSGLEWNVRVSSARNASVVDKVAAVFESYWQSGDFIPYEREQFLARTSAQGSRTPDIVLSPIELRPEPFQERLLEQIALARARGHHRNLLVSATGTGKTVMAALDYARLREELPRARLLFVAHREEILAQSRGNVSPRAPRSHLRRAVGRAGSALSSSSTCSRQSRAFTPPASTRSTRGTSTSSSSTSSTTPRRRATAGCSITSSPSELLGLTATPERSDGLPILHWFDGRIAAELRLWDAIDQHRLVPFAYFGIHDGLDLRDIPWRRGRGYDVESLSNLLHQQRRLGATGREGGQPPCRRPRKDASPRILRECRARALHGARVQRGRHPVDRDLV